MSEYKQCPNGHYYTGDYCPYCPIHSDIRKIKELHASEMHPNRETEVAPPLPLCQHCGRPVRKYVPRDSGISSIKCMGDGVVPWNYKWEGICENCGHDFGVIMNIDMGSTGPDNCFRKTTIKASSRGFLHHITCDYGEWRSTILSGVEIETHCGLGNNSEKIFLSANELKYIIEMLQDSPILKQLDYYQEGTL